MFLAIFSDNICLLFVISLPPPTLEPYNCKSWVCNIVQEIKWGENIEAVWWRFDQQKALLPTHLTLVHTYSNSDIHWSTLHCNTSGCAITTLHMCMQCSGQYSRLQHCALKTSMKYITAMMVHYIHLLWCRWGIQTTHAHCTHVCTQ